MVAGSYRQGPAQEPISVRIPEAARLTGLSRSRIYELMKSGDIELAISQPSAIVASPAFSFMSAMAR